jgi:hypothetical protein
VEIENEIHLDSEMKHAVSKVFSFLVIMCLYEESAFYFIADRIIYHNQWSIFRINTHIV